jgi:phosphate-selective porin OprO/OprP
MKIKNYLILWNTLLLFGAMFITTSVVAQNTVSGSVLDSKGQFPVPNVNVRLADAEGVEVVKTDASGMYTISIGNKTSGVLVFLHPDYDTKEVLINGKNAVDVQLVSNVRYNQYGARVSRTELSPEARNGILVMESEDGKFKYWLDNRLYFDGAMFLGDPINDIGDGVTLRRVRFAIKSILWEKWYAEIDFDFGGSAIELKDVYGKYMFNNGYIKAGHFKECFSMETTSSSRYVTFIERSLPSKFAPSRHLGVSASKWGNNWLAIGSVHFNTQGGFEEVEFGQDANKDNGIDEGVSYTGRIAFMPIQKPHKLIHIGAAASYRTPKTHEEVPGSYRFSTRSLTSVNRKKYIDTDDILDVDHRVLLGLELAGAYNNLMFQSEYMSNTVYGKDDLYEANFDGFYAQAGWLLFGSKYVYNNQEGEFTQISRANDWGDLELAFRYSYVDVNDKDANVFGGAGESYTLGLTYHINSNVKFMMNYNYLNHDRYANGKSKLFIYEDEAGNLYKDITGLKIPAGDAGDDFGFISARLEIDF